jgi:hypothetical protein
MNYKKETLKTQIECTLNKNSNWTRSNQTDFTLKKKLKLRLNYSEILSFGECVDNNFD